MAKLTVWKQRASVMCHERAVWHARHAGCLLNVSLFKRDVVVACVERKRVSDGRIDVLYQQSFTATEITDAQRWCEEKAELAGGDNVKA